MQNIWKYHYKSNSLHRDDAVQCYTLLNKGQIKNQVPDQLYLQEHNNAGPCWKGGLVPGSVICL